MVNTDIYRAPGSHWFQFVVLTALAGSIAIGAPPAMGRQLGPFQLPDRPAEVTGEQVREARQEYQAIEETVRRLAATLAGMPQDSLHRSALVDQVRQVVEQEFDRRLKLQRFEARLLRQKLGQVEDNLDGRQALREQIIQQRVHQLLAGREVGERVPTPMPVSEGDAPALLPPPSAPPLADIAADYHPRADLRSGPFILRLPGEYRQEFRDLADKMRFSATSGQIAELRVRFEELKREYHHQLNLIELELTDAMAEVEIRNQEYAEVQRLGETQYVSRAEVARAQRGLRAAEANVARMQTLLAVYHDARPPELPEEPELPREEAGERRGDQPDRRREAPDREPPGDPPAPHLAPETGPVPADDRTADNAARIHRAMRAGEAQREQLHRLNQAYRAIELPKSVTEPGQL